MSTVYPLGQVYGTSRELLVNYVSRPEVDDRFKSELGNKKHIIVHGSSKQGKTSLRKQCIAEDECITISCGKSSVKSNVYEQILKKAGVSCSITDTKTLSGGYKVKASFKAKGGIPVIGEAQGKADGEYGEKSSDTVQTTSFEIDISDANDIIRVLDESGFDKYIVLEDFHYLEEEVQIELSHDLKAFYDESDCVFIIIGVWLESNNVIMHNGDLDLRTVVIPADTWSPAKLNEVLDQGERLLRVNICHEAKEAAVKTCRGNVGLLQEIANKVCEKNEIYQTQEGDIFTISSPEEVDDVVRVIAKSKEVRYKNFLRKFSGGLGSTKHEFYKWVVYVLCTKDVDEIHSGLSDAEIFSSIKKVHPNSDDLQKVNLKSSLRNIDKVQAKIQARPIVLFYDDGSLHVVDPDFLVFLQMVDKEDLCEYLGFPSMADH